jgi:hypothetical protein
MGRRQGPAAIDFEDGAAAGDAARMPPAPRNDHGIFPITMLPDHV